MRKVSDFISSYLEYTASHEGSANIHRWSAITVLGAALERRVWLHVPQVGYIFPNVYTFIVGPPAVRKSSSARIAVNLLRSIAPGPTFIQEQLTPPVLTDTAFDAIRYVDNNGIEMPHSPIFGFAEELSNFLKDIGGGSLLDLLVKFYDETNNPINNVFERKTISRGSILIRNPSVTLLGCTTPKFLSKVIPGEAVGEGFTSRVIFVVEYANKFASAYPAAPDPKLEVSLVETLQHIYLRMNGPFTETPEARELYIPWYVQTQESAVREPDEFKSTYLARKGTHARKIAQIISASRSDDRIITDADYATAFIYLNDLEKTMFTAFSGTTGMANPQELMDQILLAIPYEPERIAHGDLLRNIPYLLEKDFRNYIVTLTSIGAIRTDVIDTTKLFYSRRRDFKPQGAMRRIIAIENRRRGMKSSGSEIYEEHKNEGVSSENGRSP